MGLDKMLVIGAALFCCGLYTILTRRNAVAVLMGVELVLNAANINFVEFSHYVSRLIAGQIFAVFVFVLAAPVEALAIASFLRLMSTADPREGVGRAPLRR